MTTPEPTALGYSREDTAWTVAIFATVGLLVFLLAPLLATWLADVPIVPFKGVLEWIGSFDQTWAWFARPAIGLVIGAVIAFVVVADAYRLEVGDEAIVVHHGDDKRRIDRTQVAAVYRDRKKVVIDGRDGRRLFEEEVESGRDAVAAAFRKHGYPWEGV